MLFGDREHEVKESILEYLRELGDSLGLLEDLLEGYLESNNAEAEVLQRLTEQNREAESVRRRVQARVYEEGFLPVLREDYVRFTRGMSGVSRATGAVGELIVYQQPPVPGPLRDDVGVLVEGTRACLESVTGAIQPFGEDEQGVNEALGELTARHRKADDLRVRMVRDLFRVDEMSLAEKLLVRDLLRGTASAADSMNRAGEHVELLQVKRTL